MKKVFVAISVILLFLVTTSIQSLAQDLIHVCINNAGHARFVADPSECKPSETPKSWYVTGPQGPQGEDGLPCWNLNGNGVCDPEEDKDGIAGCDADDCQGLPGEGCLRVYSRNSEDLGIFAGTDIPSTENNITVYLPTVKKFLRLRFESALGAAYNANRIYGVNNSVYLYYLHEDCQGEEAYINTHSGGGEYFIWTLRKPEETEHYVYEYENVSKYVKSYYDGYLGMCENAEGTVNNLNRVTKTLFDFEYPVVLPVTFNGD